LIGAALGLAVVAQESYLGMPLLTYVVMSLICGFFAYHAIGKAVTALLSASPCLSWRATVMPDHGRVVADGGHPDRHRPRPGVLALPLYAVYSWRYNLASGLRDCALAYDRIASGQSITADEHVKLTARMGATLLQRAR
jgi:hypothetical protein